MTLHDQRRLFVVGRTEVRILWWVEETVCDESAFSRKIDRPRHREILWKRFPIIRAAEDLELAACIVKLHDGHDVRWRAAAKQREVIRRSQVHNVSVRTINRRHAGGAGIDDSES